MEDIIKNEFDFYFKFTKPLVLNLSEPNERILAASWLKKLTQEDIGPDNLRTDYLKLLLFTLQRRKLVGIFGDSPDKYEHLEPFPDDINLGTIAKHLLEEEKKERLERIRKELNGEKGDSPIYTTDYSEDLLEYVAAQDIPNFGVHAFYAFSKETLPHWHHADKAIFPKIVKSAVSTNVKEPSPLSEPTVPPEAPQTTEAPSLPPEPALEPPQEPEETAPTEEEQIPPADTEGAVEAPSTEPSPKVVIASTPERKPVTPKRRSISPPFKPLGIVSPKDTEDRKPPNWGSNLLEVRESPIKEHKDFEDFLHYSYEWPEEERSAFFLEETPSFLDDTPESIPSYMKKHLDRAASLPYRTPPMRGRAFGEDLSGLKSPSMRGRDFNDLSGLRTPSMRGRSFGEDLSGLKTPSMRGRSFGEDLSGLRTPSMRGRSFGEDLSGLKTPSMRGRSFGEDLSGLRTPSPRIIPSPSTSPSMNELEKELDEIDEMIKNFGDAEGSEIGDADIDFANIDDYDLEQNEFEDLEKEDIKINEELDEFDILIRKMEQEALADLEEFEEATKLPLAQQQEHLQAREKLDNMNKLLDNLNKELEEANVTKAGVPATTPKRSKAPKRPKKKIDLSKPKGKEKKPVKSSASDVKDDEMAKMFDKAIKKVSPQPSTSGIPTAGSKIPGVGRGIGRGIPVAGGRGIPRGIPTSRAGPSGIPSTSGLPRPGSAPIQIPKPTISAPLASSTAQQEEIQPEIEAVQRPSSAKPSGLRRPKSGLRIPKPVSVAAEEQPQVVEVPSAVEVTAPSAVPSTSRLRKPTGLRRPKSVKKEMKQQDAIAESEPEVQQQVPLPTSSPPSPQAAPIIQEAVDELQPKTLAEEAMPFEELFPQMQRHYGQEEFFNLEDEPYYMDEYYSAEELSSTEKADDFEGLHYQSPPNFEDAFIDVEEDEDKSDQPISPLQLKAPKFVIDEHELPEVVTLEQIEIEERKARETMKKKETTTVREVSPTPVQEIVQKTEQQNVFDLINQQLLELEQAEVSVMPSPEPTTPPAAAISPGEVRILSPPSAGQRFTYTPPPKPFLSPPKVQFEYESPPKLVPQYIPLTSPQLSPTGIEDVAYELPPDELYSPDEELDYLDDEIAFQGDNIFDEPINILETSPTIYPESPEQIPEGVEYSPPLSAVLQQHEIPQSFLDQDRPQMQKYLVISGRAKRYARHSQPGQLSPVDERHEDILDVGFTEDIPPISVSSPYRSPTRSQYMGELPQLTREEEYYIRYYVPEEFQESVRMRTLASKLVSDLPEDEFPQEEFRLPQIPYIDVSPPPLPKAPTPSPPKQPPQPLPPQQSQQLLQVPTTEVDEITPAQAAQQSTDTKAPSKMTKTKAKTKAGEGRPLRRALYPPPDKWKMRMIPPDVQERIEKQKQYAKQVKVQKKGSKIAIKLGKKGAQPEKQETKPAAPARVPTPVPEPVPEPSPEPVEPPRPPLSPPNIQIPEDFNYLQASPPPADFYSPTLEEDMLDFPAVDEAANMLEELPPPDAGEILSPGTPSPDLLLFPVEVMVSRTPEMMRTYRRQIGKRIIVERHSKPPKLETIQESGPRTRRELAARLRTQQSAYGKELAHAETPRARQPAQARRRQRRLAKPIPKRRIDFDQFSGEELEGIAAYVRDLEQRFDLPPLPADLSPEQQGQSLLDAPITDYVAQEPLQPPTYVFGWHTPPNLKRPVIPQQQFMFAPPTRSPVRTALDEEMAPELIDSPEEYAGSPPIIAEPQWLQQPSVARQPSPVVQRQPSPPPIQKRPSPVRPKQPSPVPGPSWRRTPTPEWAKTTPKQPSPIPGPSWRRTPTPEWAKTSPKQPTPPTDAIETVQTNVEAVYENPEDFITPPRLIRHMSRVRKVMTETSPVIEAPDLPEIEGFDDGFEHIDVPEYFSPERTPPSPMSRDEAFQEMYQRVGESPGVIPMGPMFLRYYGGRTNRPMPRSYGMLRHYYLPGIPDLDIGEEPEVKPTATAAAKPKITPVSKKSPVTYDLPEVERITPHFEEVVPRETLFAVEYPNLDYSKPVEERVLPIIEDVQVEEQFPPVMQQVPQQVFVEPLPPDAFDVQLAESPPMLSPTYSPPAYQSPEFQIDNVAAGGANLYDAEPFDYESPEVSPEHSQEYESPEQQPSSPFNDAFIQSVREHEYTDRYYDVDKELMNRRLQIGNKAIRLRESKRPDLRIIAELPQYEEYISPEPSPVPEVPEQEFIPGLATPQRISPQQQAAQDFIEQISQPVFNLMDQTVVDDAGLPTGLLDPGLSIFAAPQQMPQAVYYPAIYSPTDPFTYADMYDDSLDDVEQFGYSSPPQLPSPEVADINQMAVQYGGQLDSSLPPEFASPPPDFTSPPPQEFASPPPDFTSPPPEFTSPLEFASPPQGFVSPPQGFVSPPQGFVSPPRYSPQQPNFQAVPLAMPFQPRISPTLPEVLQFRPQPVVISLSEPIQRMLDEEEAQERQMHEQIRAQQAEQNRQMQSAATGRIQRRQLQPQQRRQAGGPQVRLTRSAQLKQRQVQEQQQQQQRGAQVRFGPPTRAVSRPGSRGGPTTVSASQTDSRTSMGRGQSSGGCPASRQGRCPGGQRSRDGASGTSSSTSIGRGRKQ